MNGEHRYITRPMDTSHGYIPWMLTAPGTEQSWIMWVVSVMPLAVDFHHRSEGVPTVTAPAPKDTDCLLGWRRSRDNLLWRYRKDSVCAHFPLQASLPRASPPASLPVEFPDSLNNINLGPFRQVSATGVVGLQGKDV